MQGASIGTQPPPWPLISPGAPRHRGAGLRALRADPAEVAGALCFTSWGAHSLFFGFGEFFVFVFFFNRIDNREQTTFGVGSGWPRHVQYLQDST